MSAAPGSLRATALACGLVAAAFGVAAGALTRGFEHWTFESLRRERARHGELVAPMLAGSDAAQAGARIVDFIYTRCPSVCRALGSEYQQMQTELLAVGDVGVSLLSISFDVAHDGPQQLQAYAREHGARAPTWQVVASATPSDDEALRRALGVVVVPDGFGGYVHNGALHVVDAQGRVRGLFDYDDWRGALARARQLARAPSGAAATP